MSVNWIYLSLINVLWTFFTLVFFVGFCVHNISKNLPREYETCRLNVIFEDLIRYGKTKQSRKGNEWLRVFDVPKRWFWHFYTISACWNGFLLFSYLNFTLHRQSFPLWLTALLDTLTGVPHSDNQVPQLSTLLAQLLLFLHSLRRLQECLFVSVFSDGSMHLVQYLFGLVYYVIVGLTVVGSDRLSNGTGALLSQLDWFHVVGGALFIMASLKQHQCIVILARLRTGKSGSVETLAHRLPDGGWFELVSCPHYFAELLLYVSLTLIFGGLSQTWWIVLLYLFFSQGLEAQLCHEYYKSKYKSYPERRKAYIPFVL